MAASPVTPPESHTIAGLLERVAWYLALAHPADPVASGLAREVSAFVDQITPDRQKRDVKAELEQERRDAGITR